MPSYRLKRTCEQARKAGYYGRGAYFAENAAYVNGTYAYKVPSDGSGRTRQMLLVHVLCGTTHDCGQVVNQATRALTKPPPGCHSVSGGPHVAGNSPAETKIWIVYDRAQVYPAYLVTYCVGGGVV